jgi:hypothetical protein
MSKPPLIDVILVPSGFEYLVVRAALGNVVMEPPLLLPIPMGPDVVLSHLRDSIESRLLFKPVSRILLIGLGGSLSTRFQVGHGVIIEKCGRESDGKLIDWLSCDQSLVTIISNSLPNLQRGWLITTNRVICDSKEKLFLSQSTLADVVDMEGYPVLKILSELGHQVSILRVISDDSHHDLPDIGNIVSSAGSLRIDSLLLAFLRQPQASLRFIQGSLVGLFHLHKVCSQLFSCNPSSFA